jgi:carbon storage regulator
MLVLTRKYQEKIRIGDNITITVLRTKGKAVRLGIEAPTNVPVVRGELKFEANDVPVAEPLSAAAAPVGALDIANGKPIHEGGDESTWTTKTRPRATGRKRGLRQVAEVEHGRLPRGRVAQLMPRLVSGNGALRELLDQRSATV